MRQTIRQYQQELEEEINELRLSDGYLERVGKRYT